MLRSRDCNSGGNMQKQKNQRLIAAFEAMSEEEQDMLLGLAIARSAKYQNKKPQLRLVAAEPDPLSLPRLGRLPG